MDYFDIGQRIRKIRKACGLSQEALAEKVGISTTHMSHIETGNTKLSLPVLMELAKSLDVSADDLLYDRNSCSRGATVDSIVELLESCNPQQLKIMNDILKAAKTSFDKHL